MSPDFPAARLLRHERSYQLTYDFAHRIHTTAVYPIPSPNASTIILYGHQRGVRLIWRGGKAFKPKATEASLSATANGKSDDAVMIIDSDDEQPAEKPFEDYPEFEDYEAELHPLKPCPPVVQFLDLEFGMDVYHIAVPAAAIANADASSKLCPPLLEDKMVFAVSCGDGTVRLVTLPLAPPSPASKARPELRASFGASMAGSGIWGESVITFAANGQSISDGVSLAFVCKPSNEPQARTRSKSQSRGAPTEAWEILVASHSRDVGGLLVIYKLAITAATKNGKTMSAITKDTTEPFQTHFLPAPATHITFNPSLSPKSSHRLLVTDRHNVVRILQCLPSSPGSLVDQDPVDVTSAGGAWLVSLYPGFQRARSDASLPSIPRKVIVDAKWVLGGKAILVLLADGEWGIWDIEGTGPGSSKSIIGRQGVKGGAKTSFSISGWIDGLSMNKPTHGRNNGSTSSRFAPMTPGTRKSNEPSLFSSRAPTALASGQISVSTLPPTSATQGGDESIALWLEDSFALIPKLTAFWEAQLRKSGGGNLFSGASSAPFSRMLRLSSINLGGEYCSAISQIPPATLPVPPRKGANQAMVGSFSTEVVIAAEHRLIIISQDESESTAATGGSFGFNATVSSLGDSWAPPERESSFNNGVARKLFADDPSKSTESSDLDLLGIENALDKMESSREIIEL